MKVMHACQLHQKEINGHIGPRNQSNTSLKIYINQLRLSLNFLMHSEGRDALVINC